MAQEKVLPVDESGLYTFMEVAEVKGFSKKVLAANIRQFLESNAKILKPETEEGDSVFTARGRMIIHKGSSAIGHPSAAASYTFSVALREGKYRLLMTGFVVTPYERDRYGNFVPTAVSTPLERTPDALSKPTWVANMAYITAQCRKIADQLKQRMGETLSEAKAGSKKPAAISTKW